MSQVQRTAFHKFATDWCGQRRGLRGISRAWEGSNAPGSAHHTAGSRRIFSVCLPNATKSALVGIFPITEVRCGHWNRDSSATYVAKGSVVLRRASLTVMRLRTAPLWSQVAGGHTFFVQQLQSITGRWPMAVHATYQVSGAKVAYLAWT